MDSKPDSFGKKTNHADQRRENLTGMKTHSVVINDSMDPKRVKTVGNWGNNLKNTFFSGLGKEQLGWLSMLQAKQDIVTIKKTT